MSYAHRGELLAIKGRSVVLPREAAYWAFDTHLYGVQGNDVIAPLAGYVASLRTVEGKFGGAVAIETNTTNLLSTTASQDFSSWGTTSLTVTPDYAEAPDGSQTADRITVSSSSHYVRTTANVTASSTYTFSFYARNNGGTEAKYSVYDLTNSTNIVAPTSYFSQISDGEWHLIQVTFTAPATCTSAAVYCERDAGVTTVDLLVWHAQLENHAYGTSWVVGQATRAAGVLEYSPDIVPQGAFTWAIWGSPNGRSDSTSGQDLISLGTTESVGRFSIRNYYPIAGTDPSSNRVLIMEFGNDGGGTRQYMDLTGDPFVVGQMEHLLVTFDGTDTFAVYRNAELWHSRTVGYLNGISAFASRTSNWLIDEMM
ncbi:MAG TPA: hypothetical protein VFK03_04135, partial [Candidatus Saccharimonadales bacterium]|nr:hypothetical protein [Candidatus Saccharimonadales bacterium]